MTTAGMHAGADGPSRMWSPTRLAAGASLAAWAVLFWFLLLSGRSSLYLSSRTDWVVPVGALLLTVAASGRLASARVDHTEILDPRAAWGYGVIVLPVVAVLALPPAALGSYAASRRSSFVGSSIVTSTDDIATGNLSLADIAGALQSKAGMRALARRAGSEVSLVGFVTRDGGMPADEFILTRFLVSCCVADALSVQMRVVGAPPGKFRADDWVRVSGAVYPLGNEAIVDASGVTGVTRPEDPYLTP
jgi:putative membrane protein